MPEVLVKIENISLGCHSPSWSGQEPSSSLERPHRCALCPGHGSYGARGSSFPLCSPALECGDKGLSCGKHRGNHPISCLFNPTALTKEVGLGEAQSLSQCLRSLDHDEKKRRSRQGVCQVLTPFAQVGSLDVEAQNRLGLKSVCPCKEGP